MRKILGMGNALTDILLQIENDGVLQKLNLLKGGMQLVNFDQIAAIRTELDFSSAKMATGGSASNTVHGISKLGGVAGFVGKVGKDQVGAFFSEDSVQNGVVPHLTYSANQSGMCTVLVSKDGERTLCTYLGASSELEAGDLSKEIFNGYDVFHVEGYLVQNHALITQAVKLAKSCGLIVSIDLASYNVVEANLDFLKQLLVDYVDIVFANEDEARAFTGLEPAEALTQLSNICNIAVVKIGKEGSYVRSGNAHHVIAPYQARCVDTTGAGDLYAAGFLYGLASDYALDTCGQIGSLVSSKIVEVLGAKMTDQVWETINQEIKTMV